jgi:DNA-binding CsgD family transcriptional regulator
VTALTPADVREAFRLVHELCELADDPFNWNLRLLEGLERLTESTRSMAYVIPLNLDPGAIRLSFMLSHSFADEWLNYIDFGDVTDQPHTPAIMARLGSDFTLSRQQLVTDEVWYASPFVHTVAHPVGWDQFIVSMRVADVAGSIHCLSVVRPPGEPAYDARDCAIAHLVHDELARLWRRPVVEQVDAMPKRLGETLAAIRRGLSRKEIAAELDISVHTVHTYEKQLFNQFNVRGRGELLAKLSRSICPWLPR